MEASAQRAFDALCSGFHRNESYDGFNTKQKYTSVYSLVDVAATLGLSQGETLFLTNAFVEGKHPEEEDEMVLQDFLNLIYFAKEYKPTTTTSGSSVMEARQNSGRLFPAGDAHPSDIEFHPKQDIKDDLDSLFALFDHDGDWYLNQEELDDMRTFLVPPGTDQNAHDLEEHHHIIETHAQQLLDEQQHQQLHNNNDHQQRHVSMVPSKKPFGRDRIQIRSKTDGEEEEEGKQQQPYIPPERAFGDVHQIPLSKRTFGRLLFLQ